MLTFGCAGTMPALWAAARTGAAAMLLIAALIGTWTPALADGVAAGGCIGSWRGLNCVTRWGERGDPYVRAVPPPTDEAERERAIARDHKWLARCRPVIKQDRYGVARYHYAAPGCEFGVGEN